MKYFILSMSLNS